METKIKTLSNKDMLCKTLFILQNYLHSSIKKIY
jgi:hypothetical protein